MQRQKQKQKQTKKQAKVLLTGTSMLLVKPFSQAWAASKKNDGNKEQQKEPTAVNGKRTSADTF